MKPLRIAFVMEQGLGHTTFAHNVKAALSACPDIEPVWLPITFDGPELLARVPKLRHDVVLRAGVMARQKLSRALGGALPDAVLFHTQMTSVFCASLMRRVPGAVSLDATPKQFLRMGKWYGLQHDETAPVERLRDSWYRRVFQSASLLFPWSEWAAQDLVSEYGVGREKIRVCAPGVNLSVWRPAPKDPDAKDVRVLFVGNDLPRKGGDLLLRWMETSAPPHVHLDIVTKDAIASLPPRVHVHSDLSAGDPRLAQIYRDADLFAFPTHADCFPHVLMEAAASGLPVVATRVGAVAEMVDDGRTGFVAENWDVLSARLTLLTQNHALRREMGVAARARAEAHFDGARALAGEIDALRQMALVGRKAAA